MPSRLSLISGFILGAVYVSATPEFTTTPLEDPLPEGVCEPSLLYGLSPFEGDGSVEVMDFNQYDIYYNQTTLVGFDGEIMGFTYFGYDIYTNIMHIF